jgi:diguanylate cyclase (GGDEF)-like protein/PAS domain S-box-containing protein
VFGLAVAVFALSLVAVELRPAGSTAAAWWPAAGLAVACLVRARHHDRPALLVAVGVASGVANLVGGRSLAVAVGFGVANALEALVVTGWLTRSRADVPRLREVADVGRFLVGVLLGALVIGAGAGATVWALLDDAPLTAARTMMVSHAAAVLLIVPVVLVDRRKVSGRPLRAESALQWAAVLGVTAAVFAPGQILPLTFLPMPLLVWGAVRTGPRTTASQVAVMGALATVLTVLGGGPFAGLAATVAPAVTVGLVQLFVLVYSSVLLVLSVGIHQRGMAADQVADQEALYRGGFDQALVGMVLVRFDGSVLRVLQGNDVAARLMQTDSDKLVGSAWCRAIPLEDRAEFEAGVLAIVAGTAGGWHGEVRMVLEGQERWIEAAIAPIGDPSQELILSVQMIDVTERRLAHDRLTRMALHDPLTNLPNRVLLMDRLRHALSAATRSGRSIAVFYLDLDGFKQVNDHAGHEQGDRVLRETAELLRSVVRDADTVARLGGDEFVVVSGIGDASDAACVGHRIATTLDRTVLIAGRAYPLRVSVGIATSTPTSTAENLLHEADTAMYENKRRARALAVAGGISTRG